MANPFLFLAPLNGSLAFQDRAGGGTLTGSGAVRYQAASGARTNYAPNPTFSNNTNGWVAEGLAAIPRITTDGALGSTCIEVTCTASTSDGIGTTGATGNFRVAGPGVYTISFYAKVISGALDFVDRTLEYRADGVTNIGSNNSPTDMTFTTSWARYSHTITTIRTGVHYLTYGILRKTAAASVVRFSNFQCESGATATTYFDGSTGGAWLNPITGILGTAHASPSVSQAEAWVEEGTTNLHTNPSCEYASVSGHFAIAGATVTKDTTYAYIGSASFKTVTPNAAINEGVAFKTASGLGYTGSIKTLSSQIRLRGSGTLQVYQIISYTDASLSTGAITTVAATDSWVEVVPASIATNAGKTVDYIATVVRTTTQQAATFYVDAIQIEEKAYATSYTDGSIGTGYAWSGTAHASASTRALTTLGVAAGSKVGTINGGVAIRVGSTDKNAAVVPFAAGSYGGTGDYLGVSVRHDLASSFPRARSKVTTGTERTAIASSGMTSDVVAAIFASWTGTTIEASVGTDSPVSSGRVETPTGAVQGGSSITIGYGSSGEVINGLIGPVAIFSRPLTARERTRLYSATTWTWNMLKSGFRHGKLV